MDGSDEQKALPAPQPIKPDEHVIYVDGSMVIEHKQWSSEDAERVASGPTRTWVFHFGRTSTRTQMADAIAYAHASYRAQRAREWSTRLGRKLTDEEVADIDNGARRMATVTTKSYTQAVDYILGLLDSFQRIQTVIIDSAEQLRADMWQTAYGVMDAGTSGSGPNYDHWWIGLERVERRNYGRSARTNQRQPNTRGSYHYGQRTQSYWRHTRTR